MLQDRVNELLKAPPSKWSGKQLPLPPALEFKPHLPPIGRVQVAEPLGPGTIAHWPVLSSCHMTWVSCTVKTLKQCGCKRLALGPRNLAFPSPPPSPEPSRKRGRQVTSPSGHSVVGPRFTMEQKQAALVELSEAAAACVLNPLLATSRPFPTD